MPRPRSRTWPRAAYLALAVADTWLSGRPDRRARRLRRVTKPLLMPTLAVLTAGCTRRDNPLRRTTLLGQLGGWGGDVALLRSGTSPFLAGIGSFGIGHLAYLSGFRGLRSPSSSTGVVGVRAAGVSWLLGAPILSALAARRAPATGLPVLAYSTLLAAVVAAASRLDPALPAPARRSTSAGAWLFLVSDTTLAVRSFVLEDPAPGVERAVMATYAAAQLLLAEGALRA